MIAAIFAADADPTLWQRLDEATRERLSLTLAGFLLLLALLILLIAISARMMRRIARHRPTARRREVSDWDQRAPAEDDLPTTDHGE
ncbi:MAG: hypothetical protein WD894_09490 [Pirellulales bacterium]